MPIESVSGHDSFIRHLSADNGLNKPERTLFFDHPTVEDVDFWTGPGLWRDETRSPTSVAAIQEPHRQIRSRKGRESSLVGGKGEDRAKTPERLSFNRENVMKKWSVIPVLSVNEWSGEFPCRAVIELCLLYAVFPRPVHNMVRCAMPSACLP